MIDKIHKGNRVAGLIYYLFGPGKSDEHRDQHLVAGWRDPAEVEPPVRANGRRDFRYLVNQLNAPLDALGRRGDDNTVWQCVLSAAPEDPLLSDEQWNQIATEFMDKMGLATRDDPAGVRWVAVRHGLSNEGRDHIHIAATLARQDGSLPNIHNDYLRARKAAREIEQQFGLRVTAPADGTVAPRPTRAETEQARRTGRSEPPRITLRRIVQEAAATSISEDDFFGRIRDAGALVRVRNSAAQPDEATGYAVALPPETAGTRTTIWFGGGKLAPDLTLPKLRRRWERPATENEIPQPGRVLDTKSVRALLRSAASSAAVQATGEKGYFRRLDDAGVLVRLRYSEINLGEITGYALAFPGHLDETGNPCWYSGGKLSYRLTTPALRQLWDSPRPRSRAPAMLSPDERRVIWTDVVRLTGAGARQLRSLGTTDPAAAADVAWATADALRSSAAAIGGRPGRQIQKAADDFDRAARQTYRTIPRATAAGNGLRTASRLLAVLADSRGHGIRIIDQLIVSLIQLAEETARLRLAQMRARQAAAARQAAEHLIVLHRGQVPMRQPVSPKATTGTPTATRPANDAVRVASADIPATIRLWPPTPPEEAPQQPPGATWPSTPRRTASTPRRGHG